MSGGRPTERRNELYCNDCQEIVQILAEDDRRCSVCGSNLRSQEIPLSSQDEQHDLSSVMNRLLQAWGIDPAAESSQPASTDAVAKLKSFLAGQSTTNEVGMIVDQVKGEVILIPANFGPSESIKKAEIIIADPFHGESTLRNPHTIKDKIVLFERGICNFASKIKRAQDAGAIGVIIIQTFDVWPYSMTDSSGESDGLTIPAFMIAKQPGKGLKQYIESHTPTTISIDVRKNARECVICQVDIDVGSDVVQMPCQHLFHSACIKEWLKIRNSCPICRVEIASQNPNAQPLSSALRGDFSWSDWMS